MLTLQQSSRSARLLVVPLSLILLACSLWPEMELLVPSLPSMKQVFGVSDGQIQQLLTANFCGFLLGVLLAGPLCDSLGRRVVLVAGALCYLAASGLAAIADDFQLLMVMRFLQGFTMTGPVIAGGVILFEVTSGAKQVFWMSIANSAVTFCMAGAPIIGAWINESCGYQGNLWSICILGCLGIVPACFLIPESLPASKKKKLQLPDLLRGYKCLLQDRRYMTLAVPVCALAAGYFIYVGVSALFMVDYLGLPASHFGRYQGPIVGGFSVLSLASSRLMTKFGLKRCLAGGTVFMTVGCLGLFVMSAAGLESAVPTTVLMMLFVGGMAPVCALLFPFAMVHLPAELQGNAQALIQAMRLLFASTGTFLLGFIYEGPLLPVAAILLGIFIGSAALLWIGRRYFDEEPSSSPVTTMH